jgi:hypothetical protein
VTVHPLHISVGVRPRLSDDRKSLSCCAIDHLIRSMAATTACTQRIPSASRAQAPRGRQAARVTCSATPRSKQQTALGALAAAGALQAAASPALAAASEVAQVRRKRSQAPNPAPMYPTEPSTCCTPSSTAG